MTTPRSTALTLWWRTIRPRTLLAAFAPVVAGTAIAAAERPLRWLDLVLATAALLTATLLQIGANLVNDYADFVRGADHAGRLGPPRASQQGWIEPRALRRAAFGAFAAAGAVGIALAVYGGWPLAIIGATGILSGYYYTGGSRPYGYLGLGELFVFVYFGLAAVLGTAYLLIGRVPISAWGVGVAVGAIASAILVVNNQRDRDSDRRVGKLTLAARFGPTFARAEFSALLGLAYLGLVVSLPSQLGVWGYVPLASLPLALGLVVKFHRTDGSALNPLLGKTAALGVTVAALVALSVWGSIQWPTT